MNAAIIYLHGIHASIFVSNFSENDGMPDSKFSIKCCVIFWVSSNFSLPFEDIFYLPHAVRKTNNFIFPFAASSWSLCKVRYWSSFFISFAAIWGYNFFLIFLHCCLWSLNFLFGSLHCVSSRFRQDVPSFCLME